ncbi:MAG: hypothetical protein ABW047_07355 [Nitrospiraceae bacterium]|jgi:hypothetical protein
MSPQAQVLMPDAQPRASTRGKFMVATLFFAVIAVFYFFDLMAYVSLDVPKANRNKLLAFTAEHLRILDEASRIELGFPFDLYKKEVVRTFIYGGLRDQILV